MFTIDNSEFTRAQCGALNEAAIIVAKNRGLNLGAADAADAADQMEMEMEMDSIYDSLNNVWHESIALDANALAARVG